MGLFAWRHRCYVLCAVDVPTFFLLILDLWVTDIWFVSHIWVVFFGQWWHCVENELDIDALSNYYFVNGEVL